MFDIVVDADLILLLSILALRVLMYVEPVLGTLCTGVLTGLCSVSGWGVMALPGSVIGLLVIGFFVVFIFMLCSIYGLLASLWLVVFIC